MLNNKTSFPKRLNEGTFICECAVRRLITYNILSNGQLIFCCIADPIYESVMSQRRSSNIPSSKTQNKDLQEHFKHWNYLILFWFDGKNYVLQDIKHYKIQSIRALTTWSCSRSLITRLCGMINAPKLNIALIRWFCGGVVPHPISFPLPLTAQPASGLKASSILRLQTLRPSAPSLRRVSIFVFLSSVLLLIFIRILSGERPRHLPFVLLTGGIHVRSDSEGGSKKGW